MILLTALVSSFLAFAAPAASPVMTSSPAKIGPSNQVAPAARPSATPQEVDPNWERGKLLMISDTRRQLELDRKFATCISTPQGGQALAKCAVIKKSFLEDLAKNDAEYERQIACASTTTSSSAFRDCVKRKNK